MSLVLVVEAGITLLALMMGTVIVLVANTMNIQHHHLNIPKGPLP